MGVSGGNWADLPMEVLAEMLTKLPSIEDFIRFGAVCGSWRCALVESEKMKKSFVPWMMLSEPEPPENFLEVETRMLINLFNQKEEEEESENEDNNKDAVPPRKFFNVSSEKTLELYLPEAEGRRCFGSNIGWILTLGLDLNIHLLNPLTRLQISLPPQPTFQYQFDIEYDPDDYEHDPFEGEGGLGYLRVMYLEKFALSAHPNHRCGSCVVLVIYSEKRLLAIARPGDKAWTDVKSDEEWFDDVIFFNNTFYAVQHFGDLLVCDITTPVPVATFFMAPPFPPSHRCRFYLVEMSGHLHLVVRMFSSKDGLAGDFFSITVHFKVYKLDFGRKEWIQSENLGDHALFLGNNSSFAIYHPDLRSNCIYFTDDFSSGFEKADCDMGLFDFGEKKMIGPLYSGDCARSSTFCTPLFFIPNLH